MFEMPDFVSFVFTVILMLEHIAVRCFWFHDIFLVLVGIGILSGNFRDTKSLSKMQLFKVVPISSFSG